MEVMLIVLLLAIIVMLLVALGAWIGLFRFVYKRNKENGLAFAFLHLFLAVLSVGLIYYFKVVLDDCTGFLCGLDGAIFFLFFGSAIFAFWPFGLLLYYKSVDKKES